MITTNEVRSQLLEELYDDYKKDKEFEHLRKPGMNFVPGRISTEGKPELLLVGEAPGSMENATKQPFVGRAGVHLNEMLLEVGIDPIDVFYTNVCKYWPVDEEGANRRLTPREIEYSSHYLEEEIEIVKPLIVGLCGLQAANAIFPDVKNIIQHNGSLFREKDANYVVLYHPAYALHNPDKWAEVTAGYRALESYLNLFKNPQETT